MKCTTRILEYSQIWVSKSQHQNQNVDFSIYSKPRSRDWRNNL